MNLPPSRKDKAFSEAQTWSPFLGSMKVNRPEIEANYHACELTASDRAFLTGLPGIAGVLVLA